MHIYVHIVGYYACIACVCNNAMKFIRMIKVLKSRHKCALQIPIDRGLRNLPKTVNFYCERVPSLQYE